MNYHYDYVRINPSTYEIAEMYEPCYDSLHPHKVLCIMNAMYKIFLYYDNALSLIVAGRNLITKTNAFC